MDIWIYGYMDIWMDINDGRIFLGGGRQTPPHPHILEGLRPSNSPSISWIHPTAPHHTPPHPNILVTS